MEYIDAMRQTTSLIYNLLFVGSYAFFFNCTTVGRVSDAMTVPTKHKH